MRIFRRRNPKRSRLRPVQAQPGIDPGKSFVYQVAAWWLGVLTLWFLATVLIIAPLTQSLDALVLWFQINWDLKWLTLVLGLAGAVPFYAMRTTGQISGRRYYVNSINIESSLEHGERGGKRSESRMSNIRPYRGLPPVFDAWWFQIPYDLGDGILEWPMTMTGQHAPGIEPVPPTELPPEEEKLVEKPGPGERRDDPIDSPYNDDNQGFSRDRHSDPGAQFAEDRKPEKF